LVKAGSGVATLGIPGSAGVPESYASETLVAPYNNLSAVEHLFQQFPGQIAAVIVEPVAANMGVVPPKAGFLEGLRRLTEANGALLLFDEVITGFRVAYGGAQALYRVQPDLTCLGKVLGGGLPIGAYGGRRAIMEMVAPLGPVYQAGTLSGNPIAVAAGIATLKALQRPGVYEVLEERSAWLEEGLKRAAYKAERPVQVQRVGSLLTVFFADRPVVDFATACAADTQAYAAFFHRLLQRGIYLPPSQFEAMFLSLHHTPVVLSRTVKAAELAFRALVAGGR
jgi:glutamate-1-semialdehyde 2,1-aminomutase